ncbi:MAG: hypothetical protein EAZ89_17075 [Bacteroidetes bacterium]|nr:MAG: hypothetical protein EAZ89_17075 [Bacteroidota bacterium]
MGGGDAEDHRAFSVAIALYGKDNRKSGCAKQALRLFHSHKSGFGSLLEAHLPPARRACRGAWEEMSALGCIFDVRKRYGMIESISIENFRCFKHTRIGGFKRVNLIGGQNNAGKTSLLEAMLLASQRGIDSIEFVQATLRNVTYNQTAPELSWNGLFYQNRQQNPIEISIQYPDRTQGIQLTYEEETGSAYADRVEDTGSGQWNRIKDNRIERKVSKSILRGLLTESGELSEHGFSFKIIVNKDADPKDFVARKSNLPLPVPVPFIPAGFKPDPRSISQDVELLIKAGKEDILRDALATIDLDIDQIRVFHYPALEVNLRRAAESFLPLSLFGDAITRVIDIIVKILKSPNAVLLIDEIENGIHYTHQQEFWKLLFKVARQFNVQIFATSHSLEMIRAFNEVAANEEFTAEAQYVEMFRSVRSGEIVGNMISHDTLAYSLVNNQTFRGE